MVKSCAPLFVIPRGNRQKIYQSKDRIEFLAEKKKIVSGELVYIFPWRFYENCEIDIHEEKNSILIIVRLGNCFQKGNDNGRNYQADYVYFLLRFTTNLPVQCIGRKTQMRSSASRPSEKINGTVRHCQDSKMKLSVFLLCACYSFVRIITRGMYFQASKNQEGLRKDNSFPKWLAVLSMSDKVCAMTVTDAKIKKALPPQKKKTNRSLLRKEVRSSSYVNTVIS